jgi:hypothetical protein
MRVEVRDDSNSGFEGQTGTVIGSTTTESLKVQLDTDPTGPYYVFRADELTIV